MKGAVFIVLTIVGVTMILADELYTDVYDKMDVDIILNNDRIFRQYMNCLLDRGPCTADGRSLRRVLPDALKTNCARCNERQKVIARKMVHHIQKHKPDVWEELSNKFDPNKQYIEQFRHFLSNQ